VIAIVNSPEFLGVAEVAAALAGRFEAGAAVDGHQLLARGVLDGEGTLEQQLLRAVVTQVARLRSEGRSDIVVAYGFREPEPLSRLRRALSDLDDVIYAFRPTHDETDLARRHDDAEPEALSDLLDLHAQWLAAQQEGARRGDMGFEIRCPCDATEAAAAIWDDIHEPVELVPHDPGWPGLFAGERQRIAGALGGLALALEHIGSTAVAGMEAKPIIDILVTLAALRQAEACIEPLAGLGYAFVDYPQNRDRRFFRRGKPRSHHIQLVEQGSEAHRAYLCFRDALRTDPALREEYGALKRTACGELSDERAAYGERKTELVRRVLAECC